MIIRLLAAIFILAINATSHASTTQTLMELTNSMNREIHFLNALYDQGAAVPKGLNITVIDEAGRVKNSNNFSIAQIASPEGAVLASTAGRAAVILRGLLDAKTGGTVTLKYITNVVTGSYSECQAHVRKFGAEWRIVNAYTGAVITHAHIQTWTLGISALQGVCPDPEFTDSW